METGKSGRVTIEIAQLAIQLGYIDLILDCISSWPVQ